MCEYCRERGKRENILLHNGYLIKLKKIPIMSWSLQINNVYKKINYCPMCGRQLGGLKNE